MRPLVNLEGQYGWETTLEEMAYQMNAIATLSIEVRTLRRALKSQSDHAVLPATTTTPKSDDLAVNAKPGPKLRKGRKAKRDVEASKPATKVAKN